MCVPIGNLATARTGNLVDMSWRGLVKYDRLIAPLAIRMITAIGKSPFAGEAERPTNFPRVGKLAQGQRR